MDKLTAMLEWVKQFLEWLGITRIPEFVTLVLSSYLGYQGVPHDLVMPGITPLMYLQDLVKRSGCSLIVFKPSRREIRRRMCNLDRKKREEDQGDGLGLKKPKWAPRHFRLGHENCYLCVRGCCYFRRRKRQRIPRASRRRRARRTYWDSFLFQDSEVMYDADDEWDGKCVKCQGGTSSSSSSSSSYELVSDWEEEEDKDKLQPDQTKVVEKRGDCTYYYGYGG